MSEDDRFNTLIMEEHAAVMKAQQAYLLSIVEAARRQLVAHGIAISNLAEKTIHQRCEVSCIVIVAKDHLTKESCFERQRHKECLYQECLY